MNIVCGCCRSSENLRVHAVRVTGWARVWTVLLCIACDLTGVPARTTTDGGAR